MSAQASKRFPAALACFSWSNQIDINEPSLGAHRPSARPSAALAGAWRISAKVIFLPFFLDSTPFGDRVPGQTTIPREVRQALRIKPGDKLEYGWKETRSGGAREVEDERSRLGLEFLLDGGEGAEKGR